MCSDDNNDETLLLRVLLICGCAVGFLVVVVLVSFALLSKKKARDECEMIKEAIQENRVVFDVNKESVSIRQDDLTANGTIDVCVSVSNPNPFAIRVASLCITKGNKEDERH